MDCGTVKLQYCVKNGIETLYSMETSVPYQDSNGVYCTPRGLYCGYEETHLQQIYLHAVRQDPFSSPDYDSCYVYEVGDQRIAAYCKDGAVAQLNIETLPDAQPMNH